MLSFAAPLWLLGLLALPAIRWLHRGGRHRRALAVVHLGLWQGSAAHTAAAAERRPPDPAWRRRALFAALAALALAAPQWPAARHRATLWIDAAPSMFVREAGGTRLALALAQARRELAADDIDDVEFRLLGDPWRAIDADAIASLSASLPTSQSGSLSDSLSAPLSAQPPASPPAALRDPARWSRPPPAALLRPERRQWLLTDGVHATARAWPDGSAPDRVIQVANVLRNVGVDRLAARRNADDARRMDVLVELVNGGATAETRELQLDADGRQAARVVRTLAAGASTTLQFTLPAAARLRATLQPSDALPEDDGLALDLTPLARRRVAVDPGCPSRLRAAVAIHPGLAEAAVDAIDVDAVLDCGGAGTARERPTLRMRDAGLPALRSGAPQWSAALASSERPAVDATRLRLAGALDVQPGDRVLLALGEQPAVVRRAASPVRLDCALDFASAAAAASPDTPLLVDWLFERLLGTRLLDAIAVVDHGAGASRVVPTAGAANASSTASAAAARAAAVPAAPTAPARDLALPLLLAALAILPWEIAALALQWRRLRSTEAEAAA